MKEKKELDNLNILNKNEIMEIPATEALCDPLELSDPWSYEKDTNNGTMLLKCNFCQTRIRTKDSMKRHIKSVHEGKKPFKCNICPSAFFQNYRLKVQTVEISIF